MKHRLRLTGFWLLVVLSPLYFYLLRPLLFPRQTWRRLDALFDDVAGTPPSATRPEHPLAPVIAELHATADSLALCLPAALEKSCCDSVLAQQLYRYPTWLHESARVIERHMLGEPIASKSGPVFTPEEAAAFAAYDQLMQRLSSKD